MKSACVLLADGFEEVEAVTPIDYLRRAGIEVCVAGLGSRTVVGAHGLAIHSDADDSAMDRLYDCVVIPGGGKGSEKLAASPAVTAFVKKHAAAGKLVAAICAAPALVLHGSCGLLAGKRFTCYPGMEGMVSGARFETGRVVIDGALITSRGPGCAGEFAAAIVTALAGEAAGAELRAATLL